MSLEIPDADFKLSKGLINLRDRYIGMSLMDGRERMKSSSAMEGKNRDYRQSRSFAASYFSVESLLVLLCLTASLLILPLILPPLPPPPFMLLLVPIGILVVLMILAFMPSNVRDIASSYV